MHTAKLIPALLVLLALGLGATPARAETVACTAITALPAVITVQGIYCFTGHLNTAITSGNAIDIQTNNVVLDLNGFKLGGLAAGPGTSAFGIRAANRQNITIKNGTIRGFFRGIELGGNGSQGHVVEDIRADQNTAMGIQVQGDAHIVRNNHIVATGGSTLSADAGAVGIFIDSGTGTRVLNNDVMHTFKLGTGIATGISFLGQAYAFAVNNRITEADLGIEYLGGSTGGKYRDNLTSGVGTPYTDGTDAGNNN
jgi:hypothetical protein